MMREIPRLLEMVTDMTSPKVNVGLSLVWKQAIACGENGSCDRFWLEDGSTAISRSALNDPVALYCHYAVVATDKFG